MMKNYRHMMEQVTLSDNKKEEILEMLEKHQAKKRRMPKAARIALAAALVAVCLLSIAAAAGLPKFIPSLDHIVNITVTDDTINFDYNVNDGIAVRNGTSEWPTTDPIQLKDGRLWLVEGGKGTDITDLIDENTPLCHAVTDPNTGKVTGFFAVGGTPEDFGNIMVSLFPDGTHYSASGLNYLTEYLTYEGVDYEVLPHDGLPDEVRELWDAGTGMKCYTVYKPWVIAAIKQLGVDWLDWDQS